MLRYEPFREAISLRNAIDQLFEQSFIRPGGERAAMSMFAPMDAIESEQGYQVRVFLPNVKPEDIELTAQENTLTIKGQIYPWVRDDQKVNWLVQEIGSGTFERSVTFPKPINAEQIQTQYEHGVLSITVPLSESSRPRKISVNASSSQPEVTGNVSQ
jgi:HSP20 family protein